MDYTRLPDLCFLTFINKIENLFLLLQWIYDTLDTFH